MKNTSPRVTGVTLIRSASLFPCEVLKVLLLRGLLPESRIDNGSGCSVKDIPHLGLAPGVMSLRREPVIRVHLYRQPVMGIDNLDQQRELIPVLLKDRLTNDVAHIYLRYLLQGVPLEKAVCHHGT